MFVYPFAVDPMDFQIGGIHGQEFETREIGGVGTGDLSLRIIHDDEVAPEQFAEQPLSDGIVLGVALEFEDFRHARLAACNELHSFADQNGFFLG